MRRISNIWSNTIKAKATGMMKLRANETLRIPTTEAIISLK